MKSVTADLSPADIGEFTGCTHGADGGRLFGCLECAIKFHVARADDADRLMSFHESRVMVLQAQQRRARALSDKDRADAG